MRKKIPPVAFHRTVTEVGITTGGRNAVPEPLNVRWYEDEPVAGGGPRASATQAARRAMRRRSGCSLLQIERRFKSDEPPNNNPGRSRPRVHRRSFTNTTALGSPCVAHWAGTGRRRCTCRSRSREPAGRRGSRRYRCRGDVRDVRQGLPALRPNPRSSSRRG
jgi:hypothetical protein